MFADRAKIYIRSGKGGDGHCSFRRELYVPNGGPDGGDGGRGGDLIFEVDDGLNTLADYRHRRKYAAGDGEPGGKRRCHGKDGKDLILYVPEGTVIKESVTGKVIADMSGENRRQIILKGGKGGLGNQHFATATMQVPKYAQPGQPARELEVNLELKVIADVGLIGFPNVGKSTLLSRVTNAEPKIANYHFTTLNPNLGVVDLDGAASHHVVNHRVLEQIATRTSLIVDFGGGVKSDEDLKIAFESGAQMVTGGSVAVKDPELFCHWLEVYGSEKIILGADVKEHKIAVNGWKDESACELFPFLEDYINKGIQKVICTDISCDGMLKGPSIDLYKEMLEKFPNLYLMASGGVSNVDDIIALNEAGVPGVIFGKALYEGHITLKDLRIFL